MGGKNIGFLCKFCVFSALILQSWSFTIGNELTDIRRSGRMNRARTGDEPGPHAENRYKRTTAELERYRSFLGQSIARSEDQARKKLEQRCSHCINSESRMRTPICAKCRRLLRRNQDEEPRMLPPPLQRAQNKVLTKLLTNEAFRRKIKSSSSLFKHSLISPDAKSAEDGKIQVKKPIGKRKQRNQVFKPLQNKQTNSDDTHLSGVAKDFVNSDANGIEKVFGEYSDDRSVHRSSEGSSEDYDWDLWENCPLLLAVNEYNRVISGEVEEKCRDLLGSKSKVSSRKRPKNKSGKTGRTMETPQGFLGVAKKASPIIQDRKNNSEEIVSSQIPESLTLEISKGGKDLNLSISKQGPKDNANSTLLPNFIRRNIDDNEDLDAFVKNLVQNFKQSKEDPSNKINITEDLLKDKSLMEKLNLLNDTKIQLLIQNFDDVPRNPQRKRRSSNFDKFGYLENENSSENHDFSTELELLQDGIRGNIAQGTDVRKEFVRNSENEITSLEAPKAELPAQNVSGLLQKLKHQQEISRNASGRFSSNYSAEKGAQVTSLLKNILQRTQETDVPDRNLDTRAINLERLKKYVEDDGQVARTHEKDKKVVTETSNMPKKSNTTATQTTDIFLKKELCKDKDFAKINPQLCGDKHAEKPHSAKLEMPSVLKDFREEIKTMVTDGKDKIVPELKKTLGEIKDIPKSTFGKIEENLGKTKDLGLDKLLPRFKSGVSEFLQDEKDLITNKFTEVKEAATDLAKKGQDAFVDTFDNLRLGKEADPHENVQKLLKEANINLERSGGDDARGTVLEQTKSMKEIMKNPELVQNILKELQKVDGENILGVEAARNDQESFIESNLKAGQNIEDLLGAAPKKMGGHLNQSRNQQEVTKSTNQRVEQIIGNENVLKETRPRGEKIKQRLSEVLQKNSLFKISDEKISELRDELWHAINEPFIRYEMCHKYRDEHIVTEPENEEKQDDITSSVKDAPEKDAGAPEIDAPTDETSKPEETLKKKLFKKKIPKKSPEITEDDDSSRSQKALGGAKKELTLPDEETNEEPIKPAENVADSIIVQPDELIDEVGENPEVGEPKDEEVGEPKDEEVGEPKDEEVEDPKKEETESNLEDETIAEKASSAKASQDEDIPEAPEVEEKTSDNEENVSSKALTPSKDESIVSSSQGESNPEGLLVLGDQIKIPIMLKKNEDGNLEIALNSKKMCTETCGNFSCNCPCHEKGPVVGLNEPKTGMSMLAHDYGELYEYLKTLNEEELGRILHESRTVDIERSSERKGRHIQNYNERGVNNARSSEVNAGENRIMRPVNNVVTFVANELLNEMLQSKASDCKTDDDVKMRIFGSLLNWIGGKVDRKR